MDELDKKILNELQSNFPLSLRPYDIIAERLSVSTEELWERVNALLHEGVIRRLGASLDSRKLGYSSTLASISVPDDKVDQASELIDKYPEVTHSYLREGDFNVWFTVIAYNNERIVEILEDIRTSLGLDGSAVLNLPVTKLFKLDARFKPPE